ncbi:MAG: DNA phosphorothioation system sulfurtransferase DndC, partial [Sodalinema sp.]
MNTRDTLNLNVEDSKNSIEVLLEKVNSLTSEIQELYCADDIPWVVGYSGGKDSTAVLQLIWKALESLPEEKRVKKLYVITTDTMVENPIVSQWVNHSVESIKKVARQKNINIEPHILHPAIDSTFW